MESGDSAPQTSQCEVPEASEIPATATTKATVDDVRAVCDASSSDEEEEFFDLSPAEFIETVANESIDRLQALILRQRVEQAMELRALQFSSRVVSDSRTRLERLFTGDTAPANEPDSSNPSSSAIRNELEQLRGAQRVASVLSSSRDEIERTLSRRLRSSDTPRAEVETNESSRSDTASVNATQATQGYSIERITREQVLSEVNELVSQQLVSSLLNSTFPSRLEQSILNRMRVTGNQDIDISRPRPRIVIERGQSSSGLRSSREIGELRDEINELKSLIKLSFEMQMDMQRAFKQEMSALISGRLDDASSSRLLNSQRPVEQGKCVICVDKEIDSVLYACGHMCACFVCSLNLKQKSHNCPVCRAPIQDILRVYQTNLD